MWIFAYGSLIFRPSFEYIERRRAFVRGWVRRFWQGSPDHRGVPEAPGRVVTLVPGQALETCGGCAFRLDPRVAEDVLPLLDDRERAGFVRRMLLLHGEDHADAESFAEGITWVADETNAHFLGPLPEPDIAAYVRERHGPSGSNAAYVLSLRAALRELSIVDEHVESIADLLTE